MEVLKRQEPSETLHLVTIPFLIDGDTREHSFPSSVWHAGIPIESCKFGNRYRHYGLNIHFEFSFYSCLSEHLFIYQSIISQWVYSTDLEEQWRQTRMCCGEQ